MESLNKKKSYFGSNTKTIGIALSLHNIGYEYRHLNMYHEAGVFLQHALSVLKTLYPGGNIKQKVIGHCTEAGGHREPREFNIAIKSCLKLLIAT